MLEQARITTDFDERTRLYRNFQMIFEDELPSLPLFYPMFTWGADNAIGGIRMGPLYDTLIDSITFKTGIWCLNR
jgi:peptide/nickel transport system substrate-binding protein